jgi:hypothetical protein
MNMNENEFSVLLIEDDVDWANSYIEDAEEFASIRVIHQIPPRELLDLGKLITQFNSNAVVLDELLQQNSDASYLGIDALNYLANAFPHLPLVIVTEYPLGPELKKIPYGLVYRKRDLDDQEVKKRHFQELMDAINSYMSQKAAFEKQSAELVQIRIEAITEETIKQIARLHFLMDDAIEKVIWFPNAQRKEGQLLEVNRTALSTDSVEPFLIQASDEINIPLLVGDVSPREWERILKGEIKLPGGWDFNDFHLFEREKTLKQE